METLTQKQENFVLNLFKGMSQRDAYIAAGYSSKQLPATLDRNAFALANNNKIITRYKELQQAAEDTTIASVVERKQVLSEIIRGRFVDFMVKLTPEKLKSAALQEIRITEIGKEMPVKTTTIKLHSPIQAISELNKMERIYEAEGTMTINNRILNIKVNVDAKGKLISILNRLAARTRTADSEKHQT